MQPNHEVYRQWVALHDNESIDDQGIQGYLKLSVVVLASKVRQTVHNLEEEVLEERANEASPGGFGGLLLSGPITTQQTLNFLVVYVVRAAHHSSNHFHFDFFSHNPTGASNRLLHNTDCKYTTIVIYYSESISIVLSVYGRRFAKFQVGGGGKCVLG